MKNLSNRLQNLSSGWVAFSTLTIFLIFTATVLPQQAIKAEQVAGSGDSPDTSFYYTTSELYQMAFIYGEQGREAYVRARFTFDILFPLVYTAFLTTSISWLFRRVFAHESLVQTANMFPVVGMIFDFLENVSTSLVMARYPSQSPIVDVLAPVFTVLKWVFVNGSFILLFFGVLAAFRVKLKSIPRD